MWRYFRIAGGLPELPGFGGTYKFFNQSSLPFRAVVLTAASLLACWLASHGGLLGGLFMLACDSALVAEVSSFWSLPCELGRVIDLKGF